ncbi:vWA domain-containing protein [Thalassotalea piscium]|uniref:Ca-activated chloride channel family protein n=1 Tax=Thalassotalea piscium TaxID=1230533 RepID=A0A7X0TS87_9GAMM|nr:VWA domain-containing protein [Thalassotalea piscium]MBB6541844.1 Ca-activated chloride channel family protein [Thalassotalea piscium]
MIADFHFIRPWWLLAIIVLIIAIQLLKKYRLSQSGWQQLLPKHLASELIDNKQTNKQLSLTLPFIIGILIITALAGPTWKKLPQPVYQVARGSVLVMDMSYSMYATDIAPNRLTRARYKAIDLLERLNEGEIGLIAYAGDAFVISPLTEDINNINLLLPSLSPDLMPELGSNPYAALSLANEMLNNAGHLSGDIYWFTDGIDNADIQDITQWSRNHPHRLNILGIGTQAGAPIKLTNGELMKDDSGAIIIPKLTVSALQGVAQRGNGNFSTLATDDSDIKKLLHQPLNRDKEKKSDNTKNNGDQWQEFGPYLLLLVIPLILGYFRRGSLLAIIPFCFFLTPTQKAHASLWNDLWKTKDQQGQQHFKAQEYQQAAEKFIDPMWQGSAAFKAGNYEEALSAFQKVDTPASLYNQGNTHAKLQQFEQAIDAYNKVLAQQPNNEDAKANKALIEQLMKQQEQQEKNQDQQDNDDQEGNDQQSDQNQKDNEQGNQADNSEKDSAKNDNQASQDNSQNAEQNKEDPQQADQEPNAADKSEQEQKNQQQEISQKPENEEPPTEQKAANIAQAQLDKETEQKHQQILNKVTDDPYMLLRNKMQLEYQKRRQSSSQSGVKKKW